MLPLNRYPLSCRQAIAAYAGAITRWAAAAREDRDSVRHAVCVAVLTGEDPARAVPLALGLWRLGNRWVAHDPVVHSCEVIELADVLVSETGIVEDDADEQAIGSTNDIAQRLGVTRRRAQQLAAAQRERVAAFGDLFGGVA